MRIPTWIGIIGSLCLAIPAPLLVLVFTAPGERVERELFVLTVRYSFLVAGAGVIYFVSLRPIWRSLTLFPREYEQYRSRPNKSLKDHIRFWVTGGLKDSKPGDKSKK